MAPHSYKLLYKMERKPEGISKEEAQLKAKEGYGACDAMLLASIIYPEDGALSIYFIGEDGRTDAELADEEWFKVWALLSYRLGRSKTLPPGKKLLCQSVHDQVWATLAAAVEATQDMDPVGE